MDLQLVKTFIEVVKYKNFTLAGRSLGLSQPSVSRQIESLEELLGTTLLIRSPRAVTITQNGYRFYEKAKEFFSWIQEDFFEKSKPSIRIGSIEGWLHTKIAKKIKDLCTIFENISIELLTSSILINKVASGELDCAFTTYNIQTETISSLKIFSEDYVLISSKHLSSLDEIKHHRLIIHGETDLLYKKIQKNKFHHIKVNSILALLKMVEEGAGIAVVPSYLVTDKNLYTLKYPTKEKRNIYMNTLNYKKTPDKIFKLRSLFITDL